MNPLSKIKNAGFDLSLTDTGNIYVEPASRLTETQLEYLRTHKAEIIRELQAEAINEPSSTLYPRLVTCWTPDGNPISILAKNAEHEAFLIKMNPKPKDNQSTLKKSDSAAKFSPISLGKHPLTIKMAGDF